MPDCAFIRKGGGKPKKVFNKEKDSPTLWRKTPPLRKEKTLKGFFIYLEIYFFVINFFYNLNYK